MRKTSAALAAIVLICACLAGCGSSASTASESYAAQFVGTWNAVKLTGKQSITEEQFNAFRQLGAYDVYINLNEDGTATTNTISGKESSSGKGTWSADSATQVTLTIGGKSEKMALENGELSITENGSSLYFKKVDHRDSVSNSSAVSSNTGATGTSTSSASAASTASESAAAPSTAPNSSTSSNAAAKSSANASSSKYEASIDAAEIGQDYKGNPVLIVTYSWKNNSEKTASYAYTLHAKCFQNGVQLDTAFVYDGIDSDGYMSEVRPGYGTTFQMAYELKDTENPVEIEVGEFMSFKDEPIATKTFEF